MTTRTPGPYTMVRGRKKHREAIFIKGGNIFIAKVYGHDNQPVEENAQAIIQALEAAPE